LAHSKLLSCEMTADLKSNFDKVFVQLEKLGLLLLSDSSLPSVSGIVSGEKIRGSWWSHKSGRAIFAVSERLEDHPDVMVMKLVSEKVTFVHRKLWGKIYSIGVAREDWQVRKLSTAAKRLLQTVDAKGTLQTAGETARDLEVRLLVHADQIHTESGAHAKVLETWEVWTKRVGYRVKATSPLKARSFLEHGLAQMNADYNGNGWLPWQKY
jgi:hypothetical protein